MGYNSENYKKVKDRIEERRIRAISDAERRREELHRRSPEISEIDRILTRTGLKLFRTACSGGENVREQIERIRNENAQLQESRAAILAALDLPADYTEIKYTCPECSDTGFVGERMCKCMRRELIMEGFRSSGIGNLIEKQSFDNFDLNYYMSSKENYEMMKHNLEEAKKIAEEFGKEPRNVFLSGNTGLGKTHLSTAMAKRIIERGFDVLYESAQNIISDFEYDRFKTGRGDSGSHAEKYLVCELLIIDDLGAEVSNQFTVACIYNIINTRINRGLSTIISSNLTPEQLRARYDDRITSRLLGEFIWMAFDGTDIRKQKL